MSAELERRIANVVQLGVVSEVKHSEGLCRVSFGERVSPLSPWLMPRAGDDKEYWHPDIGEQVLYLSPFGDGSEGVVLLGVMSNKRPLPEGAAENKHIQEYKDGTRIEVDREAHKIKLEDSFGSVVRMEENLIEIADAAGNELRMTDSAFEFKDPQGSAIRMESGDIAAAADKRITVDAPEGLKITAGGKGVELEGNFIIKGDITVSGDITAAGSIKDSGGNTSNHIH